MHFISHGLAGVLVYKILDSFAPNIFPTSLIAWPVVAFIFSIIPDSDVLAIKNFRDHHKSPMHWPIIWLSLLCSAILFHFVLGPLWFATIVLFSSTILVHILLDYVAGRTAGVQALFPFSKKEMSLCLLHKEKGSFSVNKFLRKKRSKNFLDTSVKLNKKIIIDYIKFYMQNKVLFAFEVFIALAGLVVWIFG